MRRLSVLSNRLKLALRYRWRPNSELADAIKGLAGVVAKGQNLVRQPLPY